MSELSSEEKRRLNKEIMYMSADLENGANKMLMANSIDELMRAYTSAVLDASELYNLHIKRIFGNP